MSDWLIEEGGLVDLLVLTVGVLLTLVWAIQRQGKTQEFRQVYPALEVVVLRSGKTISPKDDW